MKINGYNMVLTRKTEKDPDGDSSWDFFTVKAHIEGNPSGPTWTACRFRRDDLWTVAKFDLTWDGNTAQAALVAAIKDTL